MTREYSRNFFSRKSAERFTAELEHNMAEDIIMVTFRDAFNQTQYSVRWNLAE